MSEAEQRKFERVLAAHSAPTLLGVKCANLISVQQSAGSILHYRQKFEVRSGLHMRVLCQCRVRQLVYIYHEARLAQQLRQPQNRRFLEAYGYTRQMSICEMLGRLAGRIMHGSFPHEIGIFLGYPLADVQGFIEHEGRNCLLCGCWKVYSDPESARRTFQRYDRCREILCDKIRQGCDFFHALELSKEELR